MAGLRSIDRLKNVVVVWFCGVDTRPARLRFRLRAADCTDIGAAVFTIDECSAPTPGPIYAHTLIGRYDYDVWLFKRIMTIRTMSNVTRYVRWRAFRDGIDQCIVVSSVFFFILPAGSRRAHINCTMNNVRCLREASLNCNLFLFR